MNPEVRRREWVIRIFPNDASAERLIGALLMAQHEIWFKRRCLGMGEFWEWVESCGSPGAEVPACRHA